MPQEFYGMPPPWFGPMGPPDEVYAWPAGMRSMGPPEFAADLPPPDFRWQPPQAPLELPGQEQIPLGPGLALQPQQAPQQPQQAAAPQQPMPPHAPPPQQDPPRQPRRPGRQLGGRHHSDTRTHEDIQAMLTERARQSYERNFGQAPMDGRGSREGMASMQSQGNPNLDALIRRLAGVPVVGPADAAGIRRMNNMRRG